MAIFQIAIEKIVTSKIVTSTDFKISATIFDDLIYGMVDIYFINTMPMGLILIPCDV